MVDPVVTSSPTESGTPLRPSPGRLDRLIELECRLAAGDGLEEFLQHVAALGAAEMPPGTSCTIAVELPDETPMVAGSTDDAQVVGMIDCTHWEGPCQEVRRTGQAVHVPDLDREPRRWASALEALAHGTRCWLSLPVPGPAGVAGTLTFYAPRANAFDAGAVQRAQDFAADIATVTAVALKLTRQTRLNDDLRGALASRSVIDQALGVLMAENRCGRDTAFGILRRASQNRNAKLREIAAGVVESVSGERPTSGPFQPRG